MSPTIKARALLAAIGFVALSMAARLVPWSLLAALDPKSLARNLLTGAIALGLVSIGTAWLVRRRAEWARPDLAVLPRRSLASLRCGLIWLAAGAALFATVFGVVVATGGRRDIVLVVESGALLRWGLVALGATVLGAAWEEMTFRGWAFAICVKAIGPHGVAIGLGTLFGLAHLFNPKWTVPAIASVAFAGWLLSYVMLLTQDISAAIGMHVGWNFAQSMLTSRELWAYQADPNPWRSGGQWGLEASAAGMIVTGLAAAAALAMFVARRRAAQ